MEFLYFSFQCLFYHRSPLSFLSFLHVFSAIYLSLAFGKLAVMGALSNEWLGGIAAGNGNSRDGRVETIQNCDWSIFRKMRENALTTHDRPKKGREGNPIIGASWEVLSQRQMHDRQGLVFILPGKA